MCCNWRQEGDSTLLEMMAREKTVSCTTCPIRQARHQESLFLPPSPCSSSPPPPTALAGQEKNGSIKLETKKDDRKHTTMRTKSDYQTLFLTSTILLRTIWLQQAHAIMVQNRYLWVRHNTYTTKKIYNPQESQTEEDSPKFISLFPQIMYGRDLLLLVCTRLQLMVYRV